MTYRITYAFDRDDVFTTLLEAIDNKDLMYIAKKYVTEQHGVGSWKKMIAFSFLNKGAKVNAG
jgi:hypothetical protein